MAGSFITKFSFQNRQFDGKIEYYVDASDDVIGATLTCLEEPYGDYDLSKSVDGHEWIRILDLAQAHHDGQSRRCSCS